MMAWSSPSTGNGNGAEARAKTRVSNVQVLKKLIVVLGRLAAGVIGGGLAGFVLGYAITGEEYMNPHGGLLVVGLLIFVGAILGLIVGAIMAYRVNRRMTSSG
jgi:hypothetical protein